MSNIQVTHDTDLNNARSESSIAINPQNPQQIVAGSKKFKDIKKYDFTLATAWSTDGGLTWTESAEVPIPVWEGISDPALAWDDSGNVYLVALPFSKLPAEPNRVGIAVYKSTDGGQTWSKPNLIHASGEDDKQWAAGDGNPASPFRGRIYAAWDDSSSMRFARTLDHGNTWIGTGAGPVGSILAGDSFAPEINVAADGTVYIVWAAGSEIKMVVSTDGGNSFHPAASPAKGITTLPATLPNGSFRVHTLPTACAGTGKSVVVAWADYREGLSRIYYALSTDGGASWTTGPSGQPVIPDPAAPTANQHHFHPQIVSNPSGVIGCAFYEFGLKPSAYLIDVIMARSFDGGATFSEHFTVTDQPWDPKVDAPWSNGNPNETFIGDYFGLDASSESFYPLWTDTRTGIQELWTERGYYLQQAVLFEHANFHGAHKHVFGAEPNLAASDDNFFNDRVSSLAAIDGSWAFFRDVGYKGQYPSVLAPGIYPWVEAVNIKNDDMSSLRLTSSKGLAPAPHVILFEHANFHGAHKHVFGAESNLNAADDNFFNDRVSSIVVLAGTWEFFRDAGFNGTYGTVLGPGLYPGVEAVNIKNDDMSSLQPTSSSKLASVPHVILFEHANFHGAHKHVFGAES
ncbi:MAG: beta/gamma crystallin-related protein, partial [Terriglobia bacterium]